MILCGSEGKVHVVFGQKGEKFWWDRILFNVYFDLPSNALLNRHVWDSEQSLSVRKHGFWKSQFSLVGIDSLTLGLKCWRFNGNS